MARVRSVRVRQPWPCMRVSRSHGESPSSAGRLLRDVDVRCFCVEQFLVDRPCFSISVGFLLAIPFVVVSKVGAESEEAFNCGSSRRIRAEIVFHQLSYE